tara:strand:+ start:343 stop:594 length:252 start_codon:yes stop_codon:yes gene_type:complete
MKQILREHVSLTLRVPEKTPASLQDFVKIESTTKQVVHAHGQVEEVAAPIVASWVMVVFGGLPVCVAVKEATVGRFAGVFGRI